jgi:hypothetical protein
MQKITGKEITHKSTTAQLRQEIVYHHNQFQSARSSVLSAMQIGLWHKWQCGVRLNRLKPIIGTGNWTLWVEAHLPFDERTAQRYMKIDNDNPALRSKATEMSGTEPDLQILATLASEDTKRKHAIEFVPEKEQPEHKGNAKFGRSVSFLNIANEYARLKQRHRDGLQLVDFEEAREETIELYQFLRWLHGAIDSNPWDAEPTPS